MNVREALLSDGIDINTVNLFLGWHKQNPQVWQMFEKVAMEAINAGIASWGAKGIAEVVRWKLSIEKKGEYKCNNNFVSYYARVFTLKHPQHKEFFEFRECKGLRAA